MANRSQFWVILSNPNKYPIHKVKKNKNQIVRWDANYSLSASQKIATMKPRDKILFFSTGDEMAFMGVFEVCKAPYLDPRQDDQIDKYYSQEKQWYLVDIMMKMLFDKAVPVRLVKTNEKLKDFPEITENGEEIILINENQYKCILGLRREKVGEEVVEEVEDMPMSTPQIDYSELSDIIPVGAGKFGCVFKATLRHQIVAVKKLNFDLKTLPTAAFNLEVNVLHNTPHQNIVKFLGAVRDDTNLMIVTEFIGKDLGSLIASGNQPKLSIKLSMAKDIAMGMNWLHSSKPQRLHRDLKPSNLLVDDDFTVKICDFGFSEFRDPEKKANGGGGFKGTLMYMAPELLRNSEFNEKIDVYSFAIILWELLTFQPLFPEYGENQGNLFLKNMTESRLRPQIPTTCPAPLARLITSCWDENPANRPSFSQIVSDLGEMILDEEIGDPQGKEFWKTKLNGAKQVPWEKFIDEFRKFTRDGCEARFQDLPKTPSDSDIRDASDFQLNKYLAEAPPSHGQRILIEFTRRFGTPSPPPEAINDDDALSERFLKELLVKDDFVSMSSWGSILRWFGPLFQPNKQVLFLDRIRRTLVNEYFHGDMDENASKTILKSFAQKTRSQKIFLLRFSSQPGYFTLSRVTLDSTPNGESYKTSQSRIQYENGEFIFSKKRYPTLELAISSLVPKYTICPGGKYVSLINDPLKTSGSNYIFLDDSNDMEL